MKTVRVYVPTYQRRALLPRALESLRAQEFTDWVCEVHNDDPGDTFPAELVASLGDARISIQNHEVNYGATRTFNLFYQPIKERYYSILEDDNWWDPAFLATMVREMDAHPTVTMGWCNQAVWEECADGTWRNTGRLVNSTAQLSSGLVEFGHFRQVSGGRHANGAMLVRSRPNEEYTVPFDMPFSSTEGLRERLIPHPLLYISRPLAVYAVTLDTARSRSRAEWMTTQTILAATFLKHAGDDFPVAALLAERRAEKPPGTNQLILAALVEPESRQVIKHASIRDWLLLLRGLVARPNVLFRVWASRWRHANWWSVVDRNTAARFAEAD